MIIYLIKSYLVYFTVYSLYLLYVFIGFSSDKFIFVDLLNRINLNLIYWDFSYFSWTNLTYIYMLFTPTIYVLFSFIRKLPYQAYYLSFLSTFIIIFNYSIFINVNLVNQLTFGVLSDKSNFLLTNTINKYHPLLLHLCLNSLFLFYLHQVTLVTSSKQLNLAFNNVTKFILLFYVCSLTMTLGSWWAYQEGSWGGWWAWDPSEVMGLILLLTLSATFHYNNTRSAIYAFRCSLVFFCAYLALTYFCLQSNFAITSHNFGFQNESNFTLKIYYCLAIVFFFIYIRNWLKFHFKLFLAIRLFPQNNTLNFSYYLLFIFCIVLLSLLPLLTDIVWKLFTINFINFTPNYTELLNISILSCLIYFNSYWSIFSVFFVSATQLIFVDMPSVYLILPLIIISKLTRLLIVHKSFLLLLTFAILSTNYYFSSWSYLSGNISLTSLSESITFCNLNFVDYPSIETSLSAFTLSSSLSKILLGTTPDTTLFNLVVQKVCVIQEFLSDNGRLCFSTAIFDNYTIGILELSVFSLVFLLAQLKKQFLIKC